MSQAKNGNIAILQFHGAPDVEHPWVHTPPERFEEYMQYLHDEGLKVVAMRDLAAFVDWRQKPADAWRIIEQRKAGLAATATLTWLSCPRYPTQPNPERKIRAVD